MTDLPVDLNRAQAAEYKGVSERTIDRWIRRGILPARRVGTNRIRIRRADLDAVDQPINLDSVRPDGVVA